MKTIYQQMSDERIRIITTQIDLLSHYFPQGRQRQFQELYTVSHRSLIDEPSEKSIEELEKVSNRFTDLIQFYRIFLPDIETDARVKNKIGELESLTRLIHRV